MGSAPTKGKNVNSECECTDDGGPCETHGETLVIREGASTRTGDALAATFVDDVTDILREEGDGIRPYDAAMWEAEGVAAAYWSACPNGEWADDPELADALGDAVRAAESALPRGVRVDWNDGYVITRVVGGPLADDETDGGAK